MRTCGNESNLANPRKTFFEGTRSQNWRHALFEKKLVFLEQEIGYITKAHQTITPFVTQCKPPWSIRAQHKKSSWSYKTWTLEIRVEYAVQDSCVWLSKWSLPIERSWGRCVSCAFQHWFPVVFVSDIIWPLKHFREFFDLFWSIKLFIAAKWPFYKEFSFSSLE